MTGRPAEPIPFWSEDDNYPAGVDPWSSGPTKVQPTAGQRNSGHVPATQAPAQWENQIDHATARYIDYLADIAFQNNSPILTLDTAGSAIGLTYNGVDGCMSFWSEFHQAWFILGCSTAAKFYLGDAVAVQPFTIGTTQKALGMVAGMSAGLNAGTAVLVCGNVAGGTITYTRISPALTIIGSTSTLPGTSGSCFAVHACESNNRFFILGSEDGTKVTIWYSDDFGGSWTKVTVDPTFTQTKGRIIAGHNGQLIIMQMRSTSPHTWVSNDNGATWTDITAHLASSGSFDGTVNMSYSADEDATVIMTASQTYSCVGDVGVNSFVPHLTSAFTLLDIKAFELIGSALYFQTGTAGDPRCVNYVSWDLGVHARRVSSVINGPYTTRLYKSPHGLLWTGVTTVQQCLAASGLGPTLRGE